MLPVKSGRLKPQSRADHKRVATCALMRRSKRSIIQDLVCEFERLGRDCKAERLSRMFSPNGCPSSSKPQLLDRRFIVTNVLLQLGGLELPTSWTQTNSRKPLVEFFRHGERDDPVRRNIDIHDVPTR
jgi:hypothetical protein